MDRFIPNRSASNLDVANYNVSREAKDVENMDAMSPTRVGAPPAAGRAWQQPAALGAMLLHGRRSCGAGGAARAC